MALNMKKAKPNIFTKPNESKNYDLVQLFQKGFNLHKSGQLDKALSIYKNIINLYPNHFDALHLSGVIQIQNQNFSIGLELINKALNIDHQNPEAQLNKGMALLALKKIKDAIDCFNLAITFKPLYFLAYYNLGNALFESGEFAKALISFDQAITLAPENPEPYNNKGNTLIQMGRFENAIESFNQAIKIFPNYADSYYNLSNTLMQLGHLEDALVASDKAIALSPKSNIVFSNHGNILTKLGRLDDALQSFNRSIELRPEYPEVHSNLGVALLGAGRVNAAMESFGKAVDCYKKAILLDDKNWTYYLNLGKCLLQLNRTDEALLAHKKAIQINPNDKESRINLATLHFNSFEFELGWHEYQHRKLDIPSSITLPSRLNNKKFLLEMPGKLMIMGEQGIGDQILFASMLPDLMAKHPNLAVFIDGRLVDLFQRSFPKCRFLPISNSMDTNGFDAYLSLADLGVYFRTHVSDFPYPAPYLVNDNFRTLIYKNQLPSNKLICGISWRSHNLIYGKNKSMILNDLLNILRMPSISFLNLQYKSTTHDIEFLNSSNVDFFELDKLDVFNDLDGVSSAVMACDLVVTTSNTTAHIAGALGKETLLLLPFNTGKLWYWNTYDNRNLWYPNIKVFQQKTEGDWSHPLAALQQYLETKVD